jgi:hypothetical protein
MFELELTVALDANASEVSSGPADVGVIHHEAAVRPLERYNQESTFWFE